MLYASFRILYRDKNEKSDFSFFHFISDLQKDPPSTIKHYINIFFKMRYITVFFFLNINPHRLSNIHLLKVVLNQTKKQS